MTYAPIPDPTPDRLRRFMAKVDKTDGCWNWTGATQTKGYGSFGWGPRGQARSFLAHRLAYAWFVGPLDPTLTVDHLCFNRRCVRPQHLEAVTLGENIARATTWMQPYFGRRMAAAQQAVAS